MASYMFNFPNFQVVLTNPDLIKQNNQMFMNPWFKMVIHYVNWFLFLDYDSTARNTKSIKTTENLTNLHESRNKSQLDPWKRASNLTNRFYKIMICEWRTNSEMGWGVFKPSLQYFRTTHVPFVHKLTKSMPSTRHELFARETERWRAHESKKPTWKVNQNLEHCEGHDHEDSEERGHHWTAPKLVVGMSIIHESQAHFSRFIAQPTLKFWLKSTPLPTKNR